MSNFNLNPNERNSDKRNKNKRTSIACLQQKEQQAYTALSALVDLIKGSTKPAHPLKPTMDFAVYRREVLAQVGKLKSDLNDTSNLQENQFNLMYYRHTILSATNENYRNMAILAAKHNLTPHSLLRLVRQIKKKCLRLSKEVELAERKKLAETRNDQRLKLASAVVISEVA